VLGSAVSIVALSVVVPHYALNGTTPFASRYETVGGTPGGVLRTLFTDPSAFVHEMATWHKLAFLILVFAPFVGLWALEPILLVGAVPDLAINLLSSKPEQTTVFYQYTAGIVPFVVAASVLGAARLRRRRHAPTALLAIIGCLAILSPLIYTGVSLHSRSASEVNATRKALKLIPGGVPVSASQTLGAYVSTRHVVAVFPSVKGVNWVIVGPVASGEDDPPVFRRALATLKASPAWRVVFDASGISVLERRKHLGR
jgi:uncharacterized membrane protein